MSKLQEELGSLRYQFKRKYDPATAIGNLELIEITRQIEAIEETLEKNYECEQCDGFGGTECSECGHERECGYCENGLIPKEAMQAVA